MFQAVKYLEGMLIQSQQAQRKEKKLSKDLDDLKLTEKEHEQEDTDSIVKEEIVDQEEQKQEGFVPSLEERREPADQPQQQPPKVTGASEESVEDEGIDGGDDEEEDVDNDDDQAEISIDPRTYCKLGHFHLLLEDYAKGREAIRRACH